MIRTLHEGLLADGIAVSIAVRRHGKLPPCRHEELTPSCGEEVPR